MNRVRAVASATAVELLRRRTVLVLMIAVPMAFYAARHDLLGQSIRFLALGLAWSLSTLAAFAGLAGHAVDGRLRLSGYRPGELLAGRVLGLCCLAVPLSAGYAAVVLLDRQPARWVGVLLALGITVAVALPFGLLVAAVLGRPLEAALLLLTASALQMLFDPADPLTRALPFWSVREVLTWTIDGPTDGTGAEHLQQGLVHAVATVALLAAATALVRGRALRRRRHVRSLPAPGGPSGATGGPA